MKILLSAYACEPDKGSEPGVGWHWAIELVRLGHEVHVLTRANNETAIVEEVSKLKCKNLYFIYYDLPAYLKWWKKGGRGVRTYNLLWQIGAYSVAKEMHKSLNFDLVHHITFGVVRQPSFMGGLNIPFIFGPLGGGEKAPYLLRKSYPIRGKILDFIRDCLNYFIRIDPLMRLTFRKATTIYAKTPESKNVIPECYHDKVKVQLEVGIEPIEKKATSIEVNKDNIFNVLYVGRFLYLKGGHLLLPAFSKALKELPSLKLTMIGNGPEERAWKKIAKAEGIEHVVNWISWVNQKELSAIYDAHDILLFPSLHDSSGNVVLESLAHALPVICLDLGGPSVMVDEKCGCVIETVNKSEDQVSQDLCDSILKLAADGELYSRLKKGALNQSKKYKWSCVVRGVYESK